MIGGQVCATRAIKRNSSAGGSKGPCRSLGGVRGVPPFSLTPPPEAVQEKGDLNSYNKTSRLTITIWAVGNPCCILGLPNKLKEKKVNKKYIVKLTTDERAFLLQMISTGKAAARKLL